MKSKIGLIGIILSTVLATIGCANSKSHYYSPPVEHHVGVSAGVLLPGRAKEQKNPNIPLIKLDYYAKLNENWSVGMAIKVGQNSDSTPADIPGNIPSTSSKMTTTVYSPYVQWQKHFGRNWENQINARLGASLVNQNKSIEIGAPLNTSETYQENSQGVSASIRYSRWNKNLDKSFFVEVEQDITNGENIPNSTTINTGVNFKIK